MGKLVLNHQIISNPLREQLKVFDFFKAQFQTKVYNFLQGRQLRVGDFKNLMFQRFSRENMLLTNKSAYCLCQLTLVFCYSRLNTKHKQLKDPNSNGTHIQPKSSALQNIFTNMLKITVNSFFGVSKFINPNPHKQKETRFAKFF